MAITRILLMFGESKKPTSFEDVEEVTVGFLKLVAKNLFELQDEGLILQTYCNTFEEYTDAEDHVVVANGDKVRVVQQPRPAITELAPQQSESSPLNTGLTDITNFQNATKTDWHIKWTVPLMPPQIEKKLTQGQPLTCSEREVMLGTIYQSIAPRFLFPKPSQYSYVLDKLMEKYPALLTPEPDFSMSLWKQRLMYRFQNGRKREHKDLPAIAVRKRMKKTAPSTSTKSDHAPSWGIPNYMPERAPGEDDQSIAEHIESLKLEKSKKRPNYEKVCLLMTKTLPERRKMIVTEGISISALKIDYPWLFDEEELLAEFTRLAGLDIEAAVKDGSLKATEAVHLLIKNKKKVSQAVKDGYSRMSQHQNDESKVEATLLALPELLNESSSSFLVHDEGTSASPVIVKKENEYSLTVDEVEVSRSSSLTKSIVCFVASFYVFNLAYPKLCRKFLSFVQRIFLKISDNEKVDKSVLQIQEKINNHNLLSK